jgi:two-component system chemotaxis response regulator CheB
LEPIKVLVVDDSAFMRKAITSMLSSDPGIRVIGAARDGEEAIDLVLKLQPDVVTLDVEMPRMSGLETLKVIMERAPLPVLMLSSLTTEGAKETLTALELGALDFVAKHLDDVSFNILRIRNELIGKVKAVARKKFKITPHPFGSAQGMLHPLPMRGEERGWGGPRLYSGKVSVVAIGVSTGGPKALQEVLPLLPKELPAAVLVVQHMPKGFTGPFAERLNQLSKIEIKEGENGEAIKTGMVYIAPGGLHMKAVKKRATEVNVEISEQPSDLLHRPSVDVMMLSVAEVYSGRCLGAIMTGMGNDGLEGMRAIKNSGGKTIAQDEESCIVYGMPKAVVDAGIADKVVPLSSMAGEIVNMV